jgi:hypothetical protein
MVWKKDLTPPTPKGQVIKHVGKGATEQRVPRGGMESVSGPPSVGRMLNRYPKPAPAPMVAPAPAPMGPPMGPPLPPGVGG